MIARPNRRGLQWSEADDKFLLDNYGSLSVEEISVALNRSPAAVKIRKWHLDPDGYVRRNRDELPSHQQPDAGAGYMPTPEEIAVAAAKIRGGWSERERVGRIACDKTRGYFGFDCQPENNEQVASGEM